MGFLFLRFLKINLESRKVEHYIWTMKAKINYKSLKISEDLHKELKIFVAKNDNWEMSEFAQFAIFKELQECGHKFQNKQSKSKK